MGFLLPLIPLLISLYGVLHVILYETFIGETCEEMGNHKWLLWRCKEGSGKQGFKPLEFG